jgi:hypothetical protein
MTHIDFDSPDGKRGADDPWATPIPTDTGVTAEFVNFGGAPDRSFKLDTWMVAMQSKFLEDRLVLTAGYREDEQTTNNASEGAEPYPNSRRLFYHGNNIFDDANESVFKGDTYTFGVVAHPLNWLSLTYNQAISVLPQNFFNLFGDNFGPRDGEGKDYGIRFNLLEDRLFVIANYYENNDLNQLAPESLARTRVHPALENIIQTLNENGSPLPPSLVERGIDTIDARALGIGASRERGDVTGEGIEFEVVGRITPNWSVSFNYSHNEREFTNFASDTVDFMDEVQSLWDGNTTPVSLNEPNGNVQTYVRDRDNTPDRDFTENPPTFNDHYDFARSILDEILKAEGTAGFAYREYAMNFFTTYRFDNDAPFILKRARIGIGGNYRSEPIIGYDDNNKEIMGDKSFILKLMIGKSFPLGKGFFPGRYGMAKRQSIDVQLNIENLLGEDDLEPYSAFSDGTIGRRLYPRIRRSFNLRVTYRF